jgi:hypothetical protein
MWAAGVLLLALPAIAMQFSNEVQWDETDFVVMGAVIFAACATCELAARGSSNGAYRLAAISAVGAAFLTVWANLAVGMIGPENNAYNLLFGGVLAMALSGALLVRFKPRGLAWVLLTVAVAHSLVAGFGYPSDPRGAAFSMVFALPWLASAALFLSAARQHGLNHHLPSADGD